MRFQGKVAVITGGSSGIGKELATRFVAEGGSTVIVGRDAAKAEATAKEIDATGKRVVAHAGDIALPATGEAVVKTAIDRFGRLDVLFNNAGIFGPKPFLEVTEAEYDRFLGIILKGKFFAAQAAAKAMKAGGQGGAIVQTGSMWALQAIGATPSSAYSAAMGGVHALVKNLAIELAPHKIRVNAIAPAVIETPIYSTFLKPEQVKAVLPTFNSMHPLGRNGQPADAAEALLFLASDQASFITGVVLPVDGGVMAGRQ
jgi:NAD(P)-dependent dehydrogenase (short-subunit alcohol dehydrogenase family)